MKKKIILISVVVIVLIVISFAFYVSQFYKSPLSTNPNDWGAFGSYFGGIIGPLLVIGNIVFLYHLNFQQVRDLQKPYGVIDIGNYENKIYVRLKNIGNGPLIVEKACVHYKDQEKNNLIDFMPVLPTGVHWTDFVKEIHGKGIGRDSYINLILLDTQTENIETKIKKQIRTILKDVTIEIHYKNIFNEHERIASRDLKIFE